MRSSTKWPRSSHGREASGERFEVGSPVPSPSEIASSPVAGFYFDGNGTRVSGFDRALEAYATDVPVVTSSIGGFLGYMGSQGALYNSNMTSGPGLAVDTLADGHAVSFDPPTQSGPKPAPSQMQTSVMGSAAISGSLSNVTEINFSLSATGSMSTTVAGFGGIY